MNKTLLSVNELSFIISIGMHRTLVSPETDMRHSGGYLNPKISKHCIMFWSKLIGKKSFWILLCLDMVNVFILLLDTSEKKCWPFFG
jgi:hypothetical protein